MSGRERAFAAAAREQLERLPALQAEHLRFLVAELETAQARIRELIGSASSAAGRAHWEGVQREIDRQLEHWRRAVTSNALGGMTQAAAAGRDSVALPLRAAGLQLGPDLFRVDPRTLAAGRALAIDRLRDTTAAARGRIRSALTQQLLGVNRRDQTVDLVDAALGGGARRRAMTIVNTEIGRAYSIAQYESQLQAATAGVPLKRRWVKSGKREPRSGHVAAHGQVVDIDERFVVYDPRSGTSEELRFPRDPEASAANTVNCGCRVLPVVDGNTFEKVDPETGELGRVAARLENAGMALESLGARASRASALVDRLLQGAASGGLAGAGAALLSDARFVGLSAAQAATLSRVEATLIGAAGERVLVVDTWGSVLVDRGGADSSVRLSRQEWALARGAVLTHNHPSGVGFSFEDLANASAYGLAEIRAVTGSSIYRAWPNALGWPPALIALVDPRGRTEMAAWARRAIAAIDRRYPGLTGADRAALLNAELLLELTRRYGFNYQRIDL